MGSMGHVIWLIKTKCVCVWAQIISIYINILIRFPEHSSCLPLVKIIIITINPTTLTQHDAEISDLRSQEYVTFETKI